MSTHCDEFMFSRSRRFTPSALDELHRYSEYKRLSPSQRRRLQQHPRLNGHRLRALATKALEAGALEAVVLEPWKMELWKLKLWKLKLWKLELRKLKIWWSGS